jgi:hypothetical protein
VPQKLRPEATLRLFRLLCRTGHAQACAGLWKDVFLVRLCSITDSTMRAADRTLQGRWDQQGAPLQRLLRKMTRVLLGADELGWRTNVEGRLGDSTPLVGKTALESIAEQAASFVCDALKDNDCRAEIEDVLRDALDVGALPFFEAAVAKR